MSIVKGSTVLMATPFAWAGFVACAAVVGFAVAEFAAAADSRAFAKGAPKLREGRPLTGTSVVRIRIPLNKSQTVRLGRSFNDVMVGSAEIAEVVPLDHRTVHVLGRRLGTTNVSVFDGDRHLVAVIEVEVGLDIREIAAKIKDGTGSRAIAVHGVGDRVVLSGVVSDAPTVDRAVAIASGLAPGGVVNTIRVASPQQVLLQVRLLEVNRTAGRELGFRLEHATRSSGVRVGRVGPLAPLATTGPTGLGLLTDAVPAVATATFSGTPIAQILGRFTGTSQQLDVIISAFEEKGLARRLAEPNLVAMSGDTADFLAGGEYPVPVSVTTQTGVPTITVVFKEFGVRLSFTPTVLASGLINLRLEPEVSEIDPTISVETGAIKVPGLSKRRARTTVELRDGQSFAIAGLLQTTTQRNIEQFPWLGSVPVIGALLRSTAFHQRETELVVIVTPHIVKPAAPDAVISTPLDKTVPANDVDLFLLGKLELEKVRPTAIQHFVARAGVVTGPHGHILTVPAPVAIPAELGPVPHPKPTIRARN